MDPITFLTQEIVQDIIRSIIMAENRYKTALEIQDACNITAVVGVSCIVSVWKSFTKAKVQLQCAVILL